MPEVSVIMGVYEKGSQTTDIFQSVHSILKQTHFDLEFLICDDGSSSEVINLLNTLANEDKRIMLLRAGDKLTLPQKLNYCLHHAQGQFIARQDADDISKKDRIEKQLQFLKDNKSLSFVGCNANIITNGRNAGKRVFPEFPCKEDFLFRLPFLHPTLVFKVECLEYINGYSESKFAVLCEDYDLLMRLYQNNYLGANLQEYLFYYRVEPESYKKRRYRHRINETITRYNRFRDNKMLLKGLPFIIKPLILGLIPARFVEYLKKRR